MRYAQLVMQIKWRPFILYDNQEYIRNNFTPWGTLDDQRQSNA